VSLFYQPNVAEGEFFLNEDESRHCFKVLRKRANDPIRVTDGKGMFYDALLTEVNLQKCVFKITNEQAEPTRSFYIHIAIAPTKNIERIEWFIEKSTELGVDQISFVQCEHAERIKLKPERMDRITISAMKQSLRASIPKINPLITFQDFVNDKHEEQKFIGHVDVANPYHLKDLARASSSYCVLIGPEGDFSARELALAVELGYRKVSLGNSRLRTETAGVVACHVLNLLNL
jgi:16S rRNA (uracil1498-N3)-methyltransferase